MAAYADRLMQKTINTVNNSWWGGGRTHGCLIPGGRQSLRNCCHELSPNCQAGPDLMITGQNVLFPWFYDVPIQAGFSGLSFDLCIYFVLWNKNCYATPNTHPAQLTHLSVHITEWCGCLLVVFQPTFPSDVIIYAFVIACITI